jgi:hypothetical protein
MGFQSRNTLLVVALGLGAVLWGAAVSVFVTAGVLPSVFELPVGFALLMPVLVGITVALPGGFDAAAYVHNEEMPTIAIDTILVLLAALVTAAAVVVFLSEVATAVVPVPELVSVPISFGLTTVAGFVTFGSRNADYYAT